MNPYIIGSIIVGGLGLIGVVVGLIAAHKKKTKPIAIEPIKLEPITVTVEIPKSEEIPIPPPEPRPKFFDSREIDFDDDEYLITKASSLQSDRDKGDGDVVLRRINVKREEN